VALKALSRVTNKKQITGQMLRRLETSEAVDMSTFDEISTSRRDHSNFLDATREIFGRQTKVDLENLVRRRDMLPDIEKCCIPPS
jgi:hypothetical protein